MKITTFKELKLHESILKVLEEMGFDTPTEIQASAIPVLLNTNKDFVGQAQTGTGKTAAFGIPLLSRIDFDDSSVQALVLAPTRELANQVEKEIKKFGKYTPVRTTCIYGGTGYESQIKALRSEKPHVVVGTPGRVIDMIEKKILKLDNAKFCILDEADEMLNMGFFEDVQTILSRFQSNRQLMMFSATMPKQIVRLINDSFNKPEMVKIEKKSLSNDDIEQKYFVVREKHFKEAIARLIDDAEDMYGIIFCKTKLETKTVADDLKGRGHDAEVLNGDMGQAERDHAMNNFKTKKVNLLVCTDVAARGIDVDNLTHVFNYGIPRDNESYVHRIGRTGRAGTKGKAFTITSPKSAYLMRGIERHINKKIPKDTLPTVSKLKRNLVAKELDGANFIVDAIKLKGDEFKLDESFDLVENRFDSLSKEELLKLMFVWKFNKEMRRYNNLSDIESVMDDGGKPKANQREKAGRNRRAAKGRTERSGRDGGGDRRKPFKGKSSKGKSSGRNRR
ncbi:MAG: DEAD/DEAH box helicase [Bacteriovoracaceae bacterium]|nr:DEAD/DEAH box helicase [Bacteriovoracaceae bacterium]